MTKLNLKLKEKLKTQQKVHNLKSPISDPTESVNLDQLHDLGLKNYYNPPTVAPELYYTLVFVHSWT